MARLNENLGETSRKHSLDIRLPEVSRKMLPSYLAGKNQLTNDVLIVPLQFQNDVLESQEAMKRYDQTGESVALDQAISALERILHNESLSASDQLFQMTVLDSAGYAFNRRFEYLGSAVDLKKATDLWERAVEVTPKGSPDLPARLHRLANGLSDLYDQLGDSSDLERVIDLSMRATNLTWEASPELPMRLNTLAGGLYVRYSRSGNPLDLTRATTIGRRAADLEVQDSSDLPMFLGNLAVYLRTLFVRTGDALELAEAISNWDRAVKLTPEKSPDLPLRLKNLAAGLGDRYQHTGDLQDLDDAISNEQRVIRIISKESPDFAGLLNNLASNLISRFFRTHEMEDLKQAIDFGKCAVDLTPKDSPGFLYTLAIGLRVYYENTGDLRSLEYAVGYGRHVIEITPEGSPDLPGFVNGYANSLILQYYHKGDLSILTEVIRHWERTVDVTPTGSPYLATFLNGLASALMLRFAHTDELSDLDQAIRHSRCSVNLTPDESPDLPMFISGLGLGLREHYVRTGTPTDLEQAISLAGRAVELTPVDSPHLPDFLNNLALGLSDRHSSTGNQADLTSAIVSWKRAVKLSPRGSPSLPLRYNNLATGLRTRYAISGNQSDLDQAISNWKQASSLGQSVAFEHGLRAALNWINSAVERRAWSEIEQAFSYARITVDRLLKVQWNRTNKESWLHVVQGLSASAAYALAKLDRLEEAVETIEAGRAHLLAEALEANRRDLERLPDLSHADLLARYRQAAERTSFLQQQAGQTAIFPPKSTNQPIYQLTSVRQEMETVRRDLDEAIAAIRQVPGYEDFFLPPTFEKIQQAATADAPLVYLATTPVGSVALVVHSSQALRVSVEHDSTTNGDSPANHNQTRRVSAVWLDDLTEADLRAAIYGPADGPALGGYLGAYDSWRRNPRSDAARQTWHAALDRTTHWLWDALLAPVVAHLAPSPSEGEGRGEGENSALHATFVPTGLLALLPLHAAWTEDASTPTGRRYALDALTIRYAPSAGALSQSLAGAALPAEGLLAVDNPDGSLVFSRQEVEAVRSYFPPDQTTLLAGAQATRQAVLDQFPNLPIYHFSTHGWAGWSEPLEGGLLLAGGATLTLADILDLRLAGARLAVLSACETGVPGTTLPDEVVSLPTGLVQAGVAGVVASLWAVNDLSTAMLMERFYRLWREEGLTPAEALRSAQIWLRDSSNRAKAEYFKRDVPALAGTRMPELVAAELYVERMLQRDGDARQFEHPFYWAAFTMTGA